MCRAAVALSHDREGTSGARNLTRKRQWLENLENACDCLEHRAGAGRGIRRNGGRTQGPGWAVTDGVASSAWRGALALQETQGAAAPVHQPAPPPPAWNESPVLLVGRSVPALACILRTHAWGSGCNELMGWGLLRGHSRTRQPPLAQLFLTLGSGGQSVQLGTSVGCLLVGMWLGLLSGGSGPWEPSGAAAVLVWGQLTRSPGPRAKPFMIDHGGYSRWGDEPTGAEQLLGGRGAWDASSISHAAPPSLPCHLCTLLARLDLQLPAPTPPFPDYPSLGPQDLPKGGAGPPTPKWAGEGPQGCGDLR